MNKTREIVCCALNYNRALPKDPDWLYHEIHAHEPACSDTIATHARDTSKRPKPFSTRREGPFDSISVDISMSPSIEINRLKNGRCEIDGIHSIPSSVIIS